MCVFFTHLLEALVYELICDLRITANNSKARRIEEVASQGHTYLVNGVNSMKLNAFFVNTLCIF